MNVATKTSSLATAHKPMLAFWQQQTAGFGESFMLKSLSAPPTTNERRALTLPFAGTISVPIAQRCSNNAQALYVCYLTALSVVLRTYENTARVTVHSPLYGLDGNSEPTYQETVPVGLTLTDELSLRAHLRANQEQLKQAYAYQYFPLNTLRQTTSDEALTSNVLFGMGGLHRSVSAICRAKYDLAIDMQVSDEGVTIHYTFNGNRFADAFVQVLHSHWANVLACLEYPETPLRSVNLLDEQAYNLVVNDFNQSTVSQPFNPALATIPALFEEQVRLHPDAYAVHCDGQSMTYKQLNEAATQLAYLLQTDYQIGPEDRVAVMLDRSEWLIVSLLGIMKAGAAYVPVDASYPADRKQYILDDASPKLLLTKSDYMFEVPGYTGQLLAMDIQFSVQENELPTLAPGASPANLAYIIYTSGSTGKPKGVGVEHRSVTNTLTWRKTVYALTTSDATLQLFSSAFDGSVMDMFTSLSSGGAIVMLPNDQHNNPTYLLAKIKAHGVTHLLTVPSQYKAFLQEFGQELAQLRFVTLAGEATTNSLLTLHTETVPNVELYNEYGPTENAVCSTFGRLLPNSPLTIGRAIPNTQVFIIDTNRRPLPVGVLGEIAVAGAGLARGYWNQPTLTAEKFVPNPFDPKRQSVMYLTGDLGYWMADGTIVFRGRKDYQVKVRGFRIELGEIENALLTFAGVNEAVVQDRQDATGATYLAGYVTSHDTAFDTRSLTDFLREWLPDHMVPQYVVKLARLPLTPNGKLDRKALPDPAVSSSRVCIAPTNPTEALLVDVWQGVLGKSPISIEADFFGEGGDSIKAIQVAARVHKAGYQLEVKDIFRHLVLRDLAAFLTRQKQPKTAAALPLTPAQSQWIGPETEPVTNPYRTAIFRGTVHIEAATIDQALRTLEQTYDALRLAFQVGPTGTVQLTATPTTVAPVQEHTIPASAFSSELYQDYRADLLDSLTDGQPLLRASLFHLTKTDYVCLSVHRAVADQDAWAVLLADFVRLIDGETLATPTRQGSFLGWVGQANTFRGSEALLKETTFWEQQVSRADELSGYDASQSAQAYTRFAMGKDIVEDLLVRANQAYNTHTGHLVLTAFKITMSDIFNTDSCLVGLDQSARDAFANESTRSFSAVGNYAAQFPLRLTFDGSRNLPNHVKITKEQVNQVPNRGMGYGLLTSQYGQALLGMSYIPPMNLVGSNLMLDEVLTDDMESPYFQTDKPLHVLARLVNNRLVVTLYYDTNTYSIDTMLTFRNRLEYNLLKLIVFCATQERQELTLSDYGNQHMSQDDLEQITALY